MTFPILICIVAGCCALLLAGAAAFARPRNLAQWAFLLGMLLLGFEAWIHAASLQSISLDEMLSLQRSVAFPLALIPGTWLVFSLTFARGHHREFLKRWWPVVVLITVPPVTLAVWQREVWIIDSLWTTQTGHWSFPVNFTGKVLFGLLVVGGVLIITNLEWTFRAAVGTARWKIKYAVLGFALLFGVRIYSSSQVILYSANNVTLIVLNSLALILASLLLGVWAYRSRLAHVDLYPSSTVLHKSFTVILAGAYLVVVGVLARVVAAFGGDESFPLKALFILVTLVGLGMLCLSDRARHRTTRFVNRHFKRPSYDYRNVWSAFTRRTAAVLDKPEYARTAAKVISETFEALSVTVWLAEPSRGQLLPVASSSLESGTADLAPLSDKVLAGVMREAGDPPRALNLDQARGDWCRHLKSANPAFFPKAGHRYCLPLVSGGEAVGLLVLGDRVGGLPFSPEDLELLKCLGDQIAAGARNLTLSERLVAAKELEAFQAMSAFLVHDLKNTASALGLTLRNLPAHFENPAFREDALRTVGKSVGRVNELIDRLTALRQRMEINASPADLNQVISATLGSAPDLSRVPIVRQLQPLPLVPLDSRQFESVILNLVFNARDAAGNSGEIRIETNREQDWATMAVSDTGCGMSSEFISQSLFRPFKTTKKNGLGIGMFHVKTIIEAHRGRIAVHSEPGKGTTFRIWLPLAA
jgi:putative PEP-CTERM system histidine kinase